MSDNDFPRWKYHEDGRSVVVHDEDQESQLGDCWGDAPLAVHRHPQRGRAAFVAKVTEAQPLMQVDYPEAVADMPENTEVVVPPVTDTTDATAIGRPVRRRKTGDLMLPDEPAKPEPDAPAASASDQKEC